MAEELLTRETSDKQFHWDLTPMYASDKAFETALNQYLTKINDIEKFQGTLGQSAQQLLSAIELIQELEREGSNLYVYTHLKSDQDKGNSFYQNLYAKAYNAYSTFEEAIAFFQPELLAIDKVKLESFMNELEGLKVYRQFIDDIIRFDPHTLSQEVELLLAQAAPAFSGNASTYSYLENADLVFPVIQDEDGNDVQVTNGNFIKLVSSSNRQVRMAAYKAYYETFKQFNNTMASILSTEVKQHNYFSKIRHFASAREAALFKNNVPESVYETLVKTINERVDLLHQYVGLRKDILGVDKLEMYDIYTPILGEAPIKFTYEDSKEIVLEAVKPMGPEYVKIIQEAFDEAWIDVYENKGKRSGAYSSGSYDSKPYILMNFQDGMDSLYTLIHELGHSLHSYLTNTHQPYVYSHYSIFLAEIASTTNENLLTDYLLRKYDDKAIRLYVLNHFLDGVKGTMYRQTQFAEFEQLIHEADANGTPLTGEFLNQEYKKLNEKYYGSEIHSDDYIAYEWSRIPHFYYDFYVFQYATGFSAATAFAKRILAGEEGALDKYLTFLKSGNSHYPIDTMKTAGVDMTQADYIHDALDVFEQRLNEFTSLIRE